MKSVLSVEERLKRKRDSDKEYQRKKRARLVGYKAKEYSIYRQKYPEKVSAQQKLNYALMKGKIKRSPCEACGEKRVHAHHDDYSQPLLVRWLCPIHHKLAH